MAMTYVAPLPNDYPRGVITVQVQNQTKNGSLQESGLSAQPGDTLRYVVTVHNKGASDLVDGLIETYLPEQISSDNASTAGDHTDVVSAGGVTTKEYTFTVPETALAGQTTIESCVNGTSNDKASPLRACDSTDITITAKSGDAIPSTGIATSGIIIATTLALIGGYVAKLRLLRLKRLV